MSRFVPLFNRKWLYPAADGGTWLSAVPHSNLSGQSVYYSLCSDARRRTKHMDVKYHYVRQLVIDAVIEVVYLPTTQMVAYVLAKPILKEQFGLLTEHLLGYSTAF